MNAQVLLEQKKKNSKLLHIVLSENQASQELGE